MVNNNLYDQWQLLKEMTVSSKKLTTLINNKFTLVEATNKFNANIESSVIRWLSSENPIEVKLTISISTKGFVTIFLSRADKDNLLYVNRIIDEKQEKYGELLDLHNFSDNLEHCVPQFMSKLNTFFKNEFSDYLSGEKWIEMEVDWGDYK